MIDTSALLDIDFDDEAAVNAAIERLAIKADEAFRPKLRGKVGRIIAAILEAHDDDVARVILKAAVRELKRRRKAATRKG